MNVVKERLLKFAELKGLVKADFFNKIDLVKSNFSGKGAESDITATKLFNILNNYPELNIEWLISGVGTMLKESNSLSESVQIHKTNQRKTKDAIIGIQEVPYYDLEATAGLQELFNSGIPHKVLDTIKIPNLPKCDGALTVTGDSMYPLLKSGDIVLYKQTSVENVFYGEMYLLSVKTGDWEEYITVKFVQKSDKGDDFVKLVSQNQHHQSRDVNVQHIVAIAMVKASVRYNTMF